ncbi:chorismate mutase [Natronobacillus azotifigens]|uniref:chorismate mutase n=1 Tax=Natronobacillus azotifigens TaxID=472978 RepID=A0A9J6R8H1_9BACI|nr:chorismate mutase [Natronobacillus azotifigens]MCZ0701863.1 chorismate mutase [Natronobacillus azotifigens]
MIRGVRGATTVSENNADEIILHTQTLAEEMIAQNEIYPNDVATVLVSVTADLNATFPAKPIREIEGWSYVPVMCMQEIDVPGGLAKCIRIMMTINTSKDQQEIAHVYHHEAKKLRPDLLK